MRELEAAKDQGSSRMQTFQGRSCFQCKGNSVKLLVKVFYSVDKNSLWC